MNNSSVIHESCVDQLPGIVSKGKKPTHSLVSVFLPGNLWLPAESWCGCHPGLKLESTIDDTCSSHWRKRSCFFSPKLTVWGSYKVNNLYSFVCMHFKGWGKKNAKLLSYNMERANISFSHENCLQNVNRLPMWSSETQISAVPKTFTQASELQFGN